MADNDRKWVVWRMATIAELIARCVLVAATFDAYNTENRVLAGRVVAIRERSMQGWEIRAPDGWTDKSMLIMSAPGPGANGVTANLVVTRDKMPPDLPPEGHRRYDALIDFYHSEMRTKLTRCIMTDRTAAPDHVPPFAEACVTWVAPQGPIGQWLRWIDAGNDTMIVATGTTGRDDLAALTPVFRSMIGTLRQVR